MKNNYGFTLIELLAIVVILGVIIAVAAPNAAHMYIAKYYSDKVVDGACNINNINNINPCSFTLNDLEQDGLINLKGKNCTNVMGKTIFYSSNGNSYNFDAIIPPNASDCASVNIGK